MKGRPIAAERLHITLHFLGQFNGSLFDAVAQQAKEVVASVHAGPFGIALDYAASFPNPRKNSLPFFLGCANPPVELKSFQKILSAALKQAGLRNALRGFTPHLTLLYDPKVVHKEAIDAIPWSVKEYVLVRSLVGQGRHEVLGRWVLRGL